MAGQAIGLAATDADFEPGETVGGKMFDDGLDAIVAAGGAFFTETQRLEREGGVVINDEHLLGRPLWKASTWRMARPLRFMKVWGLSNRVPQSGSLARWHCHFGEDWKHTPEDAAKRSSTMNPMLWRVSAYCRPGFPRPTMREKGMVADGGWEMVDWG